MPEYSLDEAPDLLFLKAPLKKGLELIEGPVAAVEEQKTIAGIAPAPAEE